MTEKTVKPRGGEKRKKIRVLFVCLGNICRSPAAEGVLRAKVREQGLDDRLEVDSAGTYGGHAGQLPDPRMRETALRRGYSLTHRARQVRTADTHKSNTSLQSSDGPHKVPEAPEATVPQA